WSVRRRLALVSEVDVVAALAADGGDGAVAGEDDGVVGQPTKSRPQRRVGGAPGTAPLVAAAGAAGEQGVAAEQERMGPALHQQARGAGGVAGAVDGSG